MTSQPAAPTYGQLARITDPIERAAEITKLARSRGTLPPDLAALRKAALVLARTTSITVTQLAEQVGLTHARISQLTVRHD